MGSKAEHKKGLSSLTSQKSFKNNDLKTYISCIEMTSEFLQILDVLLDVLVLLWLKK